MNNFTIDDINNIRSEHAASTRDMSFDEYKADLQQEIKPLFDLLQSMKIEQKAKKTCYPIIEASVVAEPLTTYQTNN